ncbi:MAG: hypothetical protein M0Z82_04080, partial [Actinomycetota bacterium]|nr:hypothetical protein [Actinomycetota bacterium]
ADLAVSRPGVPHAFDDLAKPGTVSAPASWRWTVRGAVRAFCGREKTGTSSRERNEAHCLWDKTAARGLGARQE